MDSILSIKDPLWSEDFAVLLGFKRSIYPGVEATSTNEFERLDRLILYVQRNVREPEAQQDIIWARFCALYLPATVNRFLDPPNETPDIANALPLKLNNAYFEMLVAIQSSSYFAKYLRSQKSIAEGGKRLTQVLGERLLEFAPTIDRLCRMNQPNGYAIDFAGSAFQLLSTLLTIFIRDKDQTTVLSDETKDGLKPWIRSWLQRYPREFLAGPCERVLLAFNRDPRFVEGANTIRRSLKNWNECGLPSCSSTANLKVCSRCRTVRYCKPEHQRAHWNFVGGVLSPIAPHKELCHATEY